MEKILFIIIVFLFFASCKKQQVTESILQTHYELWRSQNIHNYSIDQIRDCFCPDAGQLVRVTVRSDTVYSIIKISDTSTVAHPYYFTVDSLFGIIRNSVNDSLVIKYNSEFGFPEYLDINPQQHPADGGVLYETSNFQIQ
jgi:hypothetical protein